MRVFGQDDELSVSFFGDLEKRNKTLDIAGSEIGYHQPVFAAHEVQRPVANVRLGAWFLPQLAGARRLANQRRRPEGTGFLGKPVGEIAMPAVTDPPGLLMYR